MQILSSPPQAARPALAQASVATQRAVPETPPAASESSDRVNVNFDVAALKAEEKKLAEHAKLGALFGGAAGVVLGSVAGALGGAVGAVAGVTVAPAGAIVGAVALGAGGFLLATHKRQGGLALVGGVLAGALGAVAGGYGGFYGGAALGALAGSSGGVIGGLAGAAGLGTLGAGFGAITKAGTELISNKEQYPNVIAKFLADEAKEGRS